MYSTPRVPQPASASGTMDINKDLIATGPSQRRVICYWNTRSYWPTAYHPTLNALYVPYVENCLDSTSPGPGGQP